MCMACANERCNAIDNLERNHVDNKLSDDIRSCAYMVAIRAYAVERPIW